MNFSDKYLNLSVMGDVLPDGVFVCDRKGTIVYVNKANEHLTGITREECIGKNISSFTAKGGIANVIADNVIKTKAPYSSIAYSPRANIQLLETGMPIFDETEELIGVLSVDRDISKMMELTSQLKQTKSKIARFRAESDQNKILMSRLTEQHMQEQMRFSENEPPRSQAMRDTYQLAYQAAQTNVTVLLNGETGVGKEVIANYIYNNSLRKGKPFIKVNCAAIPEHLLESELFGYVKGAFTGADPKGKIGMFELANGGTLFLDEIGELPLNFQSKLLRALQQHEITKIGSSKITKLDIRVIAATNKDLAAMVEKEEFRRDLYYRLNIFPILIPALRDRKEDIIPMVLHFQNIFNKKYNKNLVISQETLQHMEEYVWPGNIRELENIIERWAVIFSEFELITWDKVAYYFMSNPERKNSDYSGRSLKELMKEREREIFRWAIHTYGSSRKIAKALGVDHSTVVRKVQALGMKLKND